MRRIGKFRPSGTRAPFDDWIDQLDVAVRATLRAYIDRVAMGGARRNVTRIKDGEGVLEIVVDTGPGYRVYYGEVGTSTLLLLTGGIKKNQSRDIETAKRYWRLYDAQTQQL